MSGVLRAVIARLEKVDMTVRLSLLIPVLAVAGGILVSVSVGRKHAAARRACEQIRVGMSEQEVVELMGSGGIERFSSEDGDGNVVHVLDLVSVGATSVPARCTIDPVAKKVTHVFCGE